MAPRTPIVHPFVYFRRSNRPSFAVATVVVVVHALGMVFLIQWFARALVGRLNASAFVTDRAMQAAGSQLGYIFFVTVLGWIIYGILLHFFLWFADAEGGLSRTLAVVGEAEMVSILLIPALFGGLWLLVGDAPTDPEAFSAYVERAVTNSSPTLLVVAFVGTLWRAVVIGAGLAIAHDVDRTKTFALSFVVGLVILILSIA